MLFAWLGNELIWRIVELRAKQKDILECETAIRNDIVYRLNLVFKSSLFMFGNYLVDAWMVEWTEGR